MKGAVQGGAPSLLSFSSLGLYVFASVMLSAADLVPILHRVALSAFVGVTALSVLAALMGRIRLRHSVLAWQRPGVLVRPLLGPVLFLLLVAGGFEHAWLTGRTVPTALLVGYPAGGLFWLAATWMLRTVVVTEYGIVYDLSRIHRTVVWSQVVDYFTTTREGRPHVVFFYRGPQGTRRRLDLPVPKAYATTFHEVVERKLGARFSVPNEEVSEEALGPLDDQIDLP